MSFIPLWSEPPVLPSQSATNIEIFTDTLNYIEKHPLPPFEVVLCSRESAQTEIRLANTTTFQMTQLLIEQGFKPLVLDMANKSSPGGSVLEGSKAQEETLCRQSNLYAALKRAEADGYYPIFRTGGNPSQKRLFFFETTSITF